MYPLVEDILSRTAHTIPGLVVQARAITLSENELWDYEYDNDDRVRAFIDSVCSFVGVTPVALTLDEAVS
jgi:hypothetical protein